MNTLRAGNLILLMMFTLIFIGACASIPTSKPIPPKVRIVSVKPTNLSLSKTMLDFKLRVSNPNTFDLPLRQLDFVASFAGDKIAQGVSKDAVTIPASGEAILEVAVATELSRLFGQIKNMLKAKEYDLAYGVKGTVKLANWPRAIPFNVEGELEQPTLDLN
ncbi:MAG: LEA type 2 family protein [Gammaproteobacteria bacterium]|nr:LEA type 2 family protein [Gammaproteobacteria bacterium]